MSRHPNELLKMGYYGTLDRELRSGATIPDVWRWDHSMGSMPTLQDYQKEVEVQARLIRDSYADATSSEEVDQALFERLETHLFVTNEKNAEFVLRLLPKPLKGIDVFIDTRKIREDGDIPSWPWKEWMHDRLQMDVREKLSDLYAAIAAKSSGSEVAHDEFSEDDDECA